MGTYYVFANPERTEFLHSHAFGWGMKESEIQGMRPIVEWVTMPNRPIHNWDRGGNITPRWTRADLVSEYDPDYQNLRTAGKDVSGQVPYFDIPGSLGPMQHCRASYWAEFRERAFAAILETVPDPGMREMMREVYRPGK